MNSINWPTPHLWVFIAQMVEHCSTNTEATGSNAVEVPNPPPNPLPPPPLLFRASLQLLKNATQLRRSHLHFHLYSRSSHFISLRVSFLSRVDKLNKLAGLQCMGLHSSAGTALQRERRGHGSNSVEAPKTSVFFRATSQLLK